MTTTPAGIFIKTNGKQLDGGTHVRIGMGISDGETLQNGDSFNNQGRYALCKHHNSIAPHFDSQEFDDMVILWAQAPTNQTS